MRLDLSSVSDDALEVLMRLFGDGEPITRWLFAQLTREQSARREGRHIDPLTAPLQDGEALHYHLRHAGAALEARAYELQSENGQGAKPYIEASDFLAALIGQDLEPVAGR